MTFSNSIIFKINRISDCIQSLNQCFRKYGLQIFQRWEKEWFYEQDVFIIDNKKKVGSGLEI
jgi:hypothetical protein